jgi:hypothetical protein
MEILIPQNNIWIKKDNVFSSISSFQKCNHSIVSNHLYYFLFLFFPTEFIKTLSNAFSGMFHASRGPKSKISMPP